MMSLMVRKVRIGTCIQFGNMRILCIFDVHVLVPCIAEKIVYMLLKTLKEEALMIMGASHVRYSNDQRKDRSVLASEISSLKPRKHGTPHEISCDSKCNQDMESLPLIEAEETVSKWSLKASNSQNSSNLETRGPQK